MLFPLRQQVLDPITGIPLGGTASFEVTRDFFLDSLVVEISGTVTGTTATAAADGILGLLKNITFNVADGASNRQQTNVSGVSAIQKGFLLTGSIDQSTLNGFLIGTGTGTFKLRYPLFFKHPQLSDPVGSAFMLPLPRYNTNPVLKLSFATQTDMDTNVSPTFAIAAGITVRVLVNKRQVDNIQFPTWQTEFIENTQTYPASGANQAYEWQVPGTYFGFGLRDYTSATAWGDISQAGTPINLEFLGTTLRQSWFTDLQYMNQLASQDNWSATTVRSQTNGLFPGLAWYNFLHDGFGLEVGEVGSSLNTNLLAGSGSRVRMLRSVTGGAAVKSVYFWDRVFGDLSNLKIA
jgi:hypothetical protein